MIKTIFRTPIIPFLRNSPPKFINKNVVQISRSFHIDASSTPNPASLVFTPSGKNVLEKGTANFLDPSDAKSSPLAERLFAIRGVKVLFFSENSISVTIEDEERWSFLKPAIYTAISEFYESKEPVMREGHSLQSSGTEKAEDDDEVVAMIKEVIESRIRPAVQEDGGDVSFEGFEDGVVKIKMQGSCVGCPSSSLTLKSGIENMLKYHLPEDVKSVSNILEEESDKEYTSVVEKLREEGKKI